VTTNYLKAVVAPELLNSPGKHPPR